MWQDSEQFDGNWLVVMLINYQMKIQYVAMKDYYREVVGALAVDLMPLHANFILPVNFGPVAFITFNTNPKRIDDKHQLGK